MTYAYIQSEDQIDKIRYSDCVIIVEAFLDIRKLEEINCESLVDVDIDSEDVYLATIRNLKAVLKNVREETELDDLITIISSNHNGDISFANMSLGRMLTEQFDTGVVKPTSPYSLIDLLNSIIEKWSTEKDLFGNKTLISHSPKSPIDSRTYSKIKEVPRL